MVFGRNAMGLGGEVFVLGGRRGPEAASQRGAMGGASNVDVADR